MIEAAFAARGCGRGRGRCLVSEPTQPWRWVNATPSCSATIYEPNQVCSPWPYISNLTGCGSTFGS